MKNVIYKIENTKNGKFYIGSAVCFNKRKSSHLSDLKLKKHHNKYLQRSYNKYGLENLIFIIVESNIERSKLLEKEQYYIDILNPAYNLCRIAGSTLGVHPSKEAIEKMRKKRIGIFKQTDSAKAAISQALKGNKYGAGKTHNRKVTKEILETVIKLKEEGYGCRKISAIVKLNKTTILNIFNKKWNYG